MTSADTGAAPASAASRPSPLLQRLRMVTGAAHARIEALLRLDGPVDLDRYLLVLRCFDAFLSAWEPRVREALPVHLRVWFNARSRHAFLRQDLRDLSDCHAPSPSSHNGGPASLSLCLGGPAAAFGSMYVLEGSALGGQVIARSMAAHHGLGPQHGARYFVGWAEHTGSMWREFRALMNTELADGAEASDQACTAAVATFEALIDLFVQRLPVQAVSGEKPDARW